MNPSSDRRGMLMSSLMASLLVACGPEQAPAADVEASEHREVTTLAQAITTGTPVSLINRGGGNCLDIAGRNMKNGGILYSWGCTGNNNQKFALQPDGAGYYSLVAQHSGLCLDVPGANTQPGVGLQQYTCTGTDDQKFALVDLGTGYYNIRSKLQPSAMLVVLHSNWDSGAGIVVGNAPTGPGSEFRLGL
ncbi:MAG TPA: RICIN domain-containing protein [Archangium sp.]|nr:RICIN domain-containing protein [Archangium sp.]